MVEDTLDGRRPGWRLRLGVAWSGLRQRGRLLSGPAGKRALNRWSTFVLTGSLLAGFVGDTTHPSASGTWQATAVLTALAAMAAGTGAALVATVAIAWRPLVTFLRAGGWPKVRRRVSWAVVATAAAAGALAWLAVLQASLTAGQLATSQAYGNVLSGLTVLFVVTTWLWARAAGAVAKHLELELRIRATETLLAACGLSRRPDHAAPGQVARLGGSAPRPLGGDERGIRRSWPRPGTVRPGVARGPGSADRAHRPGRAGPAGGRPGRAPGPDPVPAGIARAAAAAVTYLPAPPRAASPRALSGHGIMEAL